MTKKTLPILGVITISLLCGNGLRQAAVAGGPKGHLEETAYDLGRFAENAGIKEIEVPIVNVGDEPLNIAYKWSTCGCLTIVSYEKEIAPEQTGTIKLEIDPSSANLGQNLQIATFKTNDPNLPVLEIRISYTVGSEYVRISPEAIEFAVPREKLLERGNLLVETIYLVDYGSERLEVKQVKFSDPNFGYTSYDTVYTCLLGKKSHKIKFNVFMDANLPVGKIDAKLTLVTNRKGSPVIEIPIRGIIEPRVTVSPGVILLRNLVPGQDIKREIRVLSKTGHLGIGRVELSHPWLKAVITDQGGRQATILVSGKVPMKTPPGQAPAVQEAELTINVVEPDPCTMHVKVFSCESQVYENR
jgi:hypothetical protein